MAPLRWLWLGISRSSLARRLLLAQAGVLALLWTLLVGLLIHESQLSKDLQNAELIQLALIEVTESLAEQPQRRQQALQAMHRAIRGAAGGEASGMSAALVVWQHGQLVFRSDALAPLPQVPQLGQIESLSGQDGRRWQARTLQSPRSDTRVSLLMPDRLELAVTVFDRGFYLLPLVVCLPFLLLPAWLSVRLALRPWRRLDEEIAARGPSELRPLRFQPRHQELRPLVQAIDSLLQRLRDSAARERSLIADAAHELRTPLAAMRVNVEALRLHSADPDQRELMDSLLRSNERASRLVGQLLQLMRSDAAAAAQELRQMLDLEALLQDRLALLEPLAERRQIELELSSSGPLRLLVERDTLVSMIDNLVDNAIKYGPSGGRVRVALARQGDSALLSVEDQGPGIPAALHARVFDRFFRGAHATQNGSGLGLAIVKSAVDSHGGQIELAVAAAGQGLRVSIQLPLHQTHNGESAADAAPDRRQSADR